MKMPSHLSRLLCLSLALVWTQGAQASSVFWGSGVVPDALYDSAGNELDSTYSFELGTFGSFTPTYQNVDQWQANWRVMDRAFDPDSNGWNSVDRFISANFGFNTDGTSNSSDANPADVFVQGEVVYLWAYNSKNIVPGSEWALVTNSLQTGDPADDWIVPDPLDTIGSYDWYLPDPTVATIGGANGVQGPGEYSANPGVFSLQTAVVPEPGSAFLLFAAAAAHLTRRFRRPTRMFLS